MIKTELFALEMLAADDSRRAVGVLGEQFAMRDFTQSGYEVQYANLKQSRQGDLRIVDHETGEVHRIEVKTSRRGKDGCYRFTLYKHWQGRLCADHRHATHTLLICLTPTGNPVYYLIPLDAIELVHSISFRDPYTYSGKYATWRCPGGRLDRL